MRHGKCEAPDQHGAGIARKSAVLAHGRPLMSRLSPVVGGDRLWPRHLCIEASCRLAVLAFFSLFMTGSAVARPLDQVQESGVIVLCAHPNALPFSAKDGDRHGFQIELGEAIAPEVGVRLETHWAVAAYDLNRADCDFVLDAIADPEAQAESRLKLSKPYGSSGITLAVRGDNGAIHTFADIAAAGKVGILPGSMAAMYLDQHGVHTSPAGFESDLLDEVAAGELIGAAVTPTAVGYYNTQHTLHPMKAIAMFAAVRELNWNLAVGMAKPDAALTAAINAALDRLVAAGTVKAIYARYGVELAPPQ
jgi:polar amino acid transport system substrate-binding protein